MKLITKRHVLIVILLAGTVVRFVNLPQNPPSLNWDEVSHGYNAYAILKTGQDEWGKSWPLIFRAYGDYKLPVYIYTTVPFVWAFGLNAWAVRLPSVISGIIAIFLFYLLVNKLTKDRFLGILAAFLYALEPWTVVLSRPALEANFANSLILGGALFFFKSLDGKLRNFYLSALLLSLSVWTYNTARVFAPFFVLMLFILYRKEILKAYPLKKLVGVFVLFAIFFIPMLVQLLAPQGLARYGLVAIIDDHALYEIGLSRESSNFSPLVTRLVYNRVSYFIPRFIANYLSYFDPRFLFLSGSSNFQFSLPKFGVLSLVHIFTFYCGIAVAVFERKKWQIVLFFWLILSPIPGSVTREAPHALRSLVMAPAAIVFISIGINKILSSIKQINLKRIFISLYLLATFVCYFIYLKYYFGEYKTNYSWSWQYGYQELVQLIKEKYVSYDMILITKKYGEPHEFILFYWPWDPQKYRNDENLNRFYQSNWYWVDSFDKFYFLNDWEIAQGPHFQFALESGAKINCGEPKCLLITSPGNVPSDWYKIDEIKFLDGGVSYEIYAE